MMDGKEEKTAFLRVNTEREEIRVEYAEDEKMDYCDYMSMIACLIERMENVFSADTGDIIEDVQCLCYGRDFRVSGEHGC